MKIKLAILECDSLYLKRIVAMFNNKFAEELEIYSFTDLDAAMTCIIEKKIDVFFANSNFKIDVNSIPNRCGFAYLVESLDIDSVDGQKAVCKFQKGELIYKQILNIYSEQMPNITGMATAENGLMRTIAFCSPVGGVGSSTVSAACAISLANKGFRVLYLNIETFGDADNYFFCDGQIDFGDVIYAIKSNKTNRAMKLQSTVKQDATGVFFYSSVKVALDMMDMSYDDYIVLMDELRHIGTYDYVIFDMDFPISHKGFDFFRNCNSVVFVSDCTDIAEKKISKTINSIQIMDMNDSDYALQPRLWLINNKCNTNELHQNEIRLLGTFPMYQSVSASQMARQLAMSNVFEQLI